VVVLCYGMHGSDEMTLSALKRNDFLYQPYYCEENIWHLCQNPPLRESEVIFVSSKGDAFPMLNQRVTSNPQIPILWDYHVILLVKSDNNDAEHNQIVDFDTTLPFVTDISTYFSQSFLDTKLLRPDEIPFFRIVPANLYSELFSSDRSHMRAGEDWFAPPPPWPLIGNMPSNFYNFIDMTNNTLGEVLSYDAVLSRFS